MYNIVIWLFNSEFLWIGVVYVYIYVYDDDGVVNAQHSEHDIK